MNNGTDTEGCDSLLVTGNIPHHKSQQETKQVARNTTVKETQRLARNITLAKKNKRTNEQKHNG